jgi:hypothetical protein
MIELINKIHNILSLVKGFEVGYNTKTAKDGKFLIEHRGERYFVKMQKVQKPSASIFDDIGKLKYFD